MDATLNNMRLCESRGLRNVVALDQLTQETFSATSGDYFWQPDDQPLTGEMDLPLVLVSRIPETYRSINF